MFSCCSCLFSRKTEEAQKEEAPKKELTVVIDPGNPVLVLDHASRVTPPPNTTIIRMAPDTPTPMQGIFAQGEKAEEKKKIEVAPGLKAKRPLAERQATTRYTFR